MKQWRPDLYRSVNLRAERELRGISLEELSRTTRYPEKQLRELEEGEFADLPNEIYLKGMIKMYIQRLGLDPDMVNLEFLHQHKQHELAGNGNQRNIRSENKLWNAQLGPVAGFFLVTGLIMVLLWPGRDAGNETYNSTVSKPAENIIIRWEDARNKLSNWLDSGTNLFTEPEVPDDIMTINSINKGVVIKTSTANWIRTQNMVTGIENLHGFFPGESLAFSIEDETLMWFEVPESVTMVDLTTNKSIMTEPSEVIRFIPKTVRYIMENGNE